MWRLPPGFKWGSFTEVKTNSILPRWCNSFGPFAPSAAQCASCRLAHRSKRNVPSMYPQYVQSMWSKKRGWKKYRNRPFFLTLGTFCFDFCWSKRLTTVNRLMSCKASPKQQKMWLSCRVCCAHHAVMIFSFASLLFILRGYFWRYNGNKTWEWRGAFIVSCDSVSCVKLSPARVSSWWPVLFLPPTHSDWLKEISLVSSLRFTNNGNT